MPNFGRYNESVTGWIEELGEISWGRLTAEFNRVLSQDCKVQKKDKKISSLQILAAKEKEIHENKSNS